MALKVAAAAAADAAAAVCDGHMTCAKKEELEQTGNLLRRKSSKKIRPRMIERFNGPLPLKILT